MNITVRWAFVMTCIGEFKRPANDYYICSFSHDGCDAFVEGRVVLVDVALAVDFGVDESLLAI